MVLAAGLGTRLRPLSYELPKPMVPVLDRPVMAHVVDLLHKYGVTEIVANLHYFSEAIQSYFGDAINYSLEKVLFGTAGGVRNCREFLGGDSFLVISGDALTDIDLTELRKRHEQAGGVATLAVKRVTDTSQYGVVLQDSKGRISGFQEKPAPAEALSELANCGIYMFTPEIFDYFPDQPQVDWAHDVFPTLLENDVPFYVHEFAGYWNDVGSLTELRQGTYDALTGDLKLQMAGSEVKPGVVVGAGSSIAECKEVEGPIWIGRDVQIASDVRLQGPLVIGDRSIIHTGAALKDSIIFPGTEVPSGNIIIGAILSGGGIVNNLRLYAEIDRGCK